MKILKIVVICMFLTSCANLDYVVFPENEVKLAESVSTIKMLDRDSLIWACGWVHYYVHRVAGCLSIVDDHAYIYIDSGLPSWAIEQERMHQLGHVYHKFFLDGDIRIASGHGYNNVIRGLKNIVE